MRTIRYIWCGILLLLYLMIMREGTVDAASKNTDYIRVGLKTNYDKVSSITIQNTAITMGYCINNTYYEEMTLSTTKGFLVKPLRQSCYTSKAIYQSYREANQKAVSIQKLGATAYAAAIYRNTWKVYVVGEVSSSQIRNITKQSGVQFEDASKDNGHRMFVTGSKDCYIIDGKVKGLYPQFIGKRQASSTDSIVHLGARKYRDRIEIGRYGLGSVTAVNVVEMEHYLYGVVPCEVSSSWPLEALKAQAVCARGYAVTIAGYGANSNISKAYKMGDTASHQVYRGYSAEKSSTNRAVNSTAGETVKYNGKTVSTYFSSTSGGSTEAVEDVWSSAFPYLRSVPDLYETEPAKKPWIKEYRESELIKILRSKGYMVDSVEEMIPSIRTNSGRIYTLRIRGKSKEVTLQKSSIRSILSVPSTKFKVIQYGDTPDEVTIKGNSSTTNRRISNSYIKSSSGTKKASSSLEQYIVKSATNLTNFSRITPPDKNTYYIAGQGYGHGIGMSQSGAKGMAQKGYNYKQILTHYYSNTKVEK